jgi:zinc transport system substrate-binding protein
MKLTNSIARGYNPMRKRFVVVALLMLVFALMGLSADAQEKSAGKIKVIVGILPVAYFVERVGGPHVEVSVLVGPGQDPHTFDPTPKLVTKLADARVLFEMGFPFEENLVKKVGSMFKNLEVVDLQKGIKLRAVTEEEEHSHGEGKGHEHSHEAGEMDQHTWLDPQLAKIQARTIADTLTRIDPAHRAEYEKNLSEFHTDLDITHEQLTKALAPVKGKMFFVFHPAYGYFGNAYGLKQMAVQLGGKEPTARQLARLVERAKHDGVRIIFVQPQFSRKSAEALAEAIRGAVLPLDDLSQDYLKNLQDMAAKVGAALQPQTK